MQYKQPRKKVVSRDNARKQKALINNSYTDVDKLQKQMKSFLN